MKRKFIWWLGFVTLFVLFSVTAYGQWPTYHGDFQRTGVSPASIDPSTMTLDWFLQPGVGNPLNPGGSNTTGIPVFRGGQSAVIGFGKVFYVYNDASDQDVLVALDAATGAYLWSFVIRLPGLGAEATQVPTVALRDTGGPAPDTVVYVYGSNNSVHARNANTGTLIWTRTGINGAAASLTSGAPIVFDTTLIIHDNGGAGVGRRYVTALNVRNGTTVWTSNDGVLPVQMGSQMWLGPAISNDTVFVAGRGGTAVGTIHALDAKTGLLLGTYTDPLSKRYQNGVVVFDDNLIAVSRNELLDGFSSSLQVWKNTHDVAAGPTYQRTYLATYLDRFGTPEIYVEPSTGETVIVWVTIASFNGPAGDIVMHRILPGPGIPTRSLFTAAGAIHGPGAVARGDASGQAVLLQGDDAGFWYVLDGNSYGAFFGGGLTPFWYKKYPSHITAGAAISLEDDTLVVIIDGNGNCAGWRNGHVTSRPRVQNFLDLNLGTFGLPRTEVVVGIIPADAVAGTGGKDADTTLEIFQNVGNEPLTYKINWGSSAVALAAADLGGLGASLTWSRTNPTRERMAQMIAEENTVTAAGAFLEKKYFLKSRTVKEDMDIEMDGIGSLKEIQDLNRKATYFGTTKLQEAKATMSSLGWLLVNDTTGGNPSPGSAGPGDAIWLRLHAVNPNVGYGLFFGEVKLFGTNEPDAQGNPLDTTRVTVVLAIGYLGQHCHILADDTLPTGLTVTNYGRVIKQDDPGFAWKGVHFGYDGSFELGANDTTFAGTLAFSPTNDPAVGSFYSGWKSDSDCVVNTGTYTEGSVSVLMDRHVTKLSHLASDQGYFNLPLLVHEYGWAFKEAITPHASDAIFTTLVVSCTGSVAVDSVKLGAWADNDIGSGTGNNGSMLANNDAVWQYDTPIPQQLFGIARVPGDTSTVGPGVSGTATMFTSAHGTSGGIEWFPHDPVKINARFMTGFKGQIGTHPQDLHTYNGSRIVSLAPGQHYTVTYIWFGADTTGETGNINIDLLQNRLKEWLTLCGYYRGDINGVHGTTLADIVWLSNYVTKGGSDPLPFASQGDVNNDGLVDAADISYLFDFVTSSGATPAPIDYDRFVPASERNERPSLNDDPLWTP